MIRLLALVAALAAPPGTAMRHVVAAAGRGDAAVWPLLSAHTQAEYGSVAAFRRAGGARRLGAFSGKRYRVVVDDLSPGGFGVAAIDDGRRVEAAAFHREDGTWKLELTRTVRLSPLAPDPDSRIRSVLQIAVGLSAATALGQGALWLDGGPFTAESGGRDDRHVTLFGQPRRPLARGRHTVVAFASAPPRAGAIAWTFTVG